MDVHICPRPIMDVIAVYSTALSPRLECHRLLVFNLSFLRKETNSSSSYTPAIMSRREGCDPDSRRHRSRFDQEPSPKRSRRDGKPETERKIPDVILDDRDHLAGDQKHRRRLQDALPLETPSRQPSKEEAIVNKESDNSHADREGRKHSDPTEVPRSQSYFQHDERGSSRQAGRNFNFRATTEGGRRRDPKEQQNDGAKRPFPTNVHEKDERTRSHGRDNDAWRHDRYLEMEADPKPPARKRPSFREKKIPDDQEKAVKSVVEPVKQNASEHPVVENEKRDERGYNSRHLDRSDRPAGNRDANVGEARRGNYTPRGRYGNRIGYNQERDRAFGRQGYRPPGDRVEKWKHDLYDEANRSPSPKNEDDAIAKVEALLAL